MIPEHRVLPAAAIPVRSEVLVDLGAGLVPVTLRKIHNADPDPGRIRWETSHGDVPVGGAQRVVVTRLP